MTAEQLEKIEKHFSTFRDMIAEIFSVSSGETEISFANPSEMLFELSNRIVAGYNEFTNSNLYSFFVGVALIFLMTNFIIQIQEENDILREEKLLSQRMIKKYLAFITAMLLIYWMRSIIYFILSLFRFVLYYAVDITEKNTEIVEIAGIIDANEIAYKIIEKENILEGEALIEETIARSKMSELRSIFTLPWIVSWISKLGIVVIAMENAVRLLTYVSVYVLAITDVIKGIKNSRIIEYTKNIIALAFQQTIIIMVLYFFKIVCNPYLRDILEKVKEGNGNYLSLSMVFVGVQFAKFIVLIGSRAISRTAFGIER